MTTGPLIPMGSGRYGRQVRPLMGFVAMTVLLAGVLGTFSTISQADCAAPVVATVRSARSGETILVRGKYWAAGCNDVQTCSVGCGGQTCSGGGLSPPESDLTLGLAKAAADEGTAGVLLAQGIEAVPKKFTVRTEVTLPADLAPGRYVITMGNDRSGVYRSEVIVIKRGE